MASRKGKIREIPWGDLAHIPDERAREPWETVATHEEWVAMTATAVGRRHHPPCPVLIGFTPTWGPEIVRYEPGSGRPCPGCGSVTVGRDCHTPLRLGEACVVCGATAAQPIQWPMQPPLRGRVRRLKGGVGGTA